jgi:hypothetical protein
MPNVETKDGRDSMTNTQEVTVHVDLDNELATAWLDRLLECTRHPMYQNGIRLIRKTNLTEER